MIKKYNHVILIKNEKNLGIAAALNQLIEFTRKNKTRFLLTLDQDSFLKPVDIERMKWYFDEKKVAMVCPEVMDKNKIRNKTIKKEYVEVERCISSGTFMDLDLCKKVGGFNEEMFIDYVDFDFCKRLRLSGDRILKIRGCDLEHSIGKRTVRRFLGIKVYPTNHNNKRVYYQARNMQYYYLTYKKQMSLAEKIDERVRMVWKFWSILLYEDDKKGKLEAFGKGKKDAEKMMRKK